jgi:hypothetical protein
MPKIVPFAGECAKPRQLESEFVRLGRGPKPGAFALPKGFSAMRIATSGEARPGQGLGIYQSVLSWRPISAVR